MENAFKVKNELKEIGLYSTKSSIYNSKKIMDECEICKTKANEVHHINFQNLANELGHIDSFHKNMKGNLCGICDKCHDKVHNNEIIVHGYVETSLGTELKFEYVKKEKLVEMQTTKKKFNNEEIEYIKNLYNSNNKLKHKQIISNFQSNFNKSISSNIISKIIKNIY
jgi:DNA mismatch repair protein MutS